METVTIKIQPKREKKKEAVLRSRQMDDTSGLAFQSVSLTLTEKETDTNKGKTNRDSLVVVLVHERFINRRTLFIAVTLY